MPSIIVKFEVISNIDITIDSSSAGYYSKEYNSGGFVVSYQVNSSPVTLPFTLSVSDVLRVTPIGATGSIEIL